MLVYDWWGVGESSSGFEEGRIPDWMTQTIEVFDTLTIGKQILLGASMGGIIATLLAQLCPLRAKGLIGRSTGFGPELVKLIDAHYGERLVVSRNGGDGLSFSFNEHTAFPPIPVTQPARFLHGQKDDRVHWQSALNLANALEADDVRFLLDKDGVHSQPSRDDVSILINWIEELRS